MKGIVLLLSTVLFFVSCGAVPKLENLDTQAPPVFAHKGPAMFPTREWQFVHSIEATIQARQKALLIGITDISPALGSVRCIIMTIEGLVLFDALSDDETVIRRGIRPFDSTAFAEGLMKDIKLIFFSPEGGPVNTGILGEGSYVRRYRNSADTIIDLIAHPDRNWEIRQYKNGDLARSVKAYLKEDVPYENQYVVPEKLVLKAHGVRTYEIALRLIWAEHVAR